MPHMIQRAQTDGENTQSFRSAALTHAATTPTDVYVDDIFSGSFRSLILLRFIRQFVPPTVFCVNYIIWLIIRLFAVVLSYCGCGDGKFASSATLRDLILKSVISIAVSDGGIDLNSTSSTDRRTDYTRRWRKSVWRTFWRLYAVLAYDIKEFMNDYCEAWKLSEENKREFILFTDNSARLAIPCSRSMDDKDLLQRIRVFYNLSRVQGGLFEFLGTKTSLRIEVVTLVKSHAVGTRVGSHLDLGRYGSFSRLVYYLKDPSKMAGSHALMERLEYEGVLTKPREQTSGLNIVRAWDPYITSTIVLLPVLFSFFVSITWTLVASIYFKADVNTSTQTGFTIGSYVVTAGALLIALVAFLDSKYVTNDGVSSMVLSRDESPQLSLSSSSIMGESCSKLSSRQLTPQAPPTPASTPGSVCTPVPTASLAIAPALAPAQEFTLKLTDPNKDAV